MTRSSQPLWVMRALIRNDQALVAHYVSWLRASPEMPLPADRDHVVTEMHAAIKRIQARRSERRLLTSPAAPASPKTLAGSLVTHGAVQPD